MTKNNIQDSMDADELIKTSETFVSEVESEMKNRMEKSKKEARKTIQEQDIEQKNCDMNPFWSPPIVGAEFENSNIIKFKLIDELPNGKDTLTIKAPKDDEIRNKSHKLNRLLSLYNINPDEISDLTGEKIPLRPQGYPIKSKEECDYVIDYPPIQTKPNKILYKLKRTGMKYNILRWGKQQYRGSKETNSTVVSLPALPLAKLYLDDYETGLVPTEKVTLFSLLVCNVLFAYIFAYILRIPESQIGALESIYLIIASVLVSLVIIYNITIFGYISDKCKSYIKNKYFP